MNHAYFLDPCTNGVGYSLLMIVPSFYLLSAVLFALLGVSILIYGRRANSPDIIASSGTKSLCSCNMWRMMDLIIFIFSHLVFRVAYCVELFGYFHATIYIYIYLNCIDTWITVVILRLSLPSCIIPLWVFFLFVYVVSIFSHIFLQ